MASTVLDRDLTDPRTLGVLVEAKLREWNITYRYEPELPLDQLRVADWAQHREADHISDKDTVSEFRTQMAAGVIYPPVVLMAPDVLIDGNTRVTAARGLKRRTFPAMVGEFPSVEVAKAFAASVNQLNGRRLTTAEAFRTASTMLRLSMGDDAIAREIGRSVETVRQFRREIEFTERADQLNLSEKAATISKPAKVRLAQIAHKPPFARALELVAEARPSAEVVKNIVRVATEAESDTAAIDAIEEIRRDLKPAGPPPRLVTVPVEVKMSRAHLGALLKYTDHPTSLLDLADEDRRTQSIALWRATRDLATKVLELYGDSAQP